ncbi:NAD(P)H-dependent oxidoreductase [Helicobacter labacensis]|uniref:NAD(P)H-dependent oxidoreductase n=1 Tax=Helicobacter labacensis TaxID=2316079 RepID=UPI000EABC862|nr:NAD(P)H-dependent oxidoreductase [Helicobacter labacensis]
MPALVIFAHPNFATSRINKALKNALEGESVVFSDLYSKYPDFKIDVLAEQELLLQHQHIVFQFPICWYSYPPLLKQYLDDVLTYGFAFGASNKALAGKSFYLCTSFGAQESAYLAPGSYSVETLLSPFKATTKFVGATLQGHFKVFGSAEISDANLAQICQEYRQFLTNTK